MTDANLVPDKLTPLTVDELIDGMAAGYRKTMGADPSSETLSILVAQACLETGNGKAIHCFNLGNVKRAADWDGLWCMYRCNELISGRVEWFDPPHPQTHFRAFATAADGCAEYVAFLATRDRYRRAWHAAYVGDSIGFVHELAVAGYFTANEAAYTKAVASISMRVRPACDRVLAALGHGLTDEDREHVSGLVALTLSDLAFARAAEPERLP